MEGNCQAYCDGDGYMECNGDFIDKQDIEAAIAWVEANLGIDIEYEAEAEGEAECVGNKCEAEGEASASVKCTAATPGAHPSAYGLLDLFSLLF
jgi:hypothetical protein